uniref:Uncharacterized protein n=1 Tax=Anguilla anguilla TaxID=7936 RepID=A0A0E9QCX3_ANGAN
MVTFMPQFKGSEVDLKCVISAMDSNGCVKLEGKAFVTRLVVWRIFQ